MAIVTSRRVQRKAARGIRMNLQCTTTPSRSRYTHIQYMVLRNPSAKLRVSVCLFVFIGGLEAQTGVISTVAGITAPGAQAARGFSGDGAPASLALLALANLQNQCDPNQFEQ